MKTNAARLLDRLGAAYELRDYEVGDDHLDAETVAGRIGMPPEQVFKTLVASGARNGVCLAVIPGSAQLHLKDVQALTGYVRGGVTALACKKDYPVFIDETVDLYDRIAVSAGVRGTQIVLSPADYLKATNATPGDIAR
ncbi:MAG: aminoacyl-tRNA deacylase [Bryobacterales bacterium]|nr:aminoacyl-tRNA deacylase [Bryobacterales bacterium]